MSRVQLAINVPDLNAAIAFYQQLFGVAPHKVRTGYANFEVADPPLKLVLVERVDANQLNHLGVEVDTGAEVRAEAERLAAAGMETAVEQATVCCHAEQDKVWVRDPGGIRWEVYTITDDEPSAGEREGLAPRMREPSAGEREGLAPRMREPSAGEREGLAPRMREPSAGEREGLAPRMREPELAGKEAALTVPAANGAEAGRACCVREVSA